MTYKKKLIGTLYINFKIHARLDVPIFVNPVF